MQAVNVPRSETSFLGPIAALFALTVRRTLLERKIWLTLLTLAGPSVLILAIRSVAPPLTDGGEVWAMYHVPHQFLLLQVAIPLVCMVHGITLIVSEVEARTFVHLTTRRLHRGTVLLTKFAATALVLITLCEISTVSLHLCQWTRQDLADVLARSPAYAAWSPRHDLLCYLQVVPAAVVAYLAVFSLFGLVTAQPLALSVAYVIIVELVMGNIPLGVRVYTVSHQLRATMIHQMPLLRRLYDMPADVWDRVYPPGVSGMPRIAGMVLVALAVCAILVTFREMLPAKVTRE